MEEVKLDLLFLVLKEKKKKKEKTTESLPFFFFFFAMKCLGAEHVKEVQNDNFQYAFQKQGFKQTHPKSLFTYIKTQYIKMNSQIGSNKRLLKSRGEGDGGAEATLLLDG